MQEADRSGADADGQHAHGAVAHLRARAEKGQGRLHGRETGASDAGRNQNSAGKQKPGRGCEHDGGHHVSRYAEYVNAPEPGCASEPGDAERAEQRPQAFRTLQYADRER